MKRRKLIYGIITILVVGMAAWVLFRPERLWVNTTVNEGLPVTALPARGTTPTNAEPVTLAAGKFHGVAHAGVGTATVYQLADGKRLLRFTNFETSNGPDVRVYLVAAEDARDGETVKKAGFVEVGVLKGNIGDQNYDVPATIDLAKYRAVTIWCKRFSVNFATAPLTVAQPKGAQKL